MLISPEEYYQKYLKGKTEKELLSKIRGIKNEIGRLKNVLENPMPREVIAEPDEDTLISAGRLYLEQAKKALAEIGGSYITSKAEMRAEKFEENIPSIEKIVLSIGGFFGGFCTYTIAFEGNKVIRDFDAECESVEDKDEFLEELSRLYIGEWRKTYSPERFGYSVCDGTQWTLTIHYLNGEKPVEICGDNAYPYNFDGLCELLGVHDINDE